MNEVREPLAERDDSDGRRSLALRVGLAVAVLGLVIAGYFVGRSVNDEDVSGAGTPEPTAAASSSETALPTASATTTPESPTDATTLPITTSEAPMTTSTSDAPMTTVDVSHGPLVAGAAVQVTSTQWVDAAAAIEVVAAVTGIATESGTCTVVATAADLNVVEEFPAFFDGKGTSCGVMQVPLAEPRSGVWSVSVVFDSPGGAAVSEPASVNVP